MAPPGFTGLFGEAMKSAPAHHRDRRPPAGAVTDEGQLGKGRQRVGEAGKARFVPTADRVQVKQQRDADLLADFVNLHHQRIVEIEADLVLAESLGPLVHVTADNALESAHPADDRGSRIDRAKRNQTFGKFLGRREGPFGQAQKARRFGRRQGKHDGLFDVVLIHPADEIRGGQLFVAVPDRADVRMDVDVFLRTPRRPVSRIQAGQRPSCRPRRDPGGRRSGELAAVNPESLESATGSAFSRVFHFDAVARASRRGDLDGGTSRNLAQIPMRDQLGDDTHRNFRDGLRADVQAQRRMHPPQASAEIPSRSRSSKISRILRRLPIIPMKRADLAAR